MRKQIFYTLISGILFLIGLIMFFGWQSAEISALCTLTSMVFMNKCEIEELKGKMNNE